MKCIILTSLFSLPGCSEVKPLDRNFPVRSELMRQTPAPRSSYLKLLLPPPPLGDSHAVKELPVRLVSFALGHQAVQLVDKLGLHLYAKKTQ